MIFVENTSHFTKPRSVKVHVLTEFTPCSISVVKKCVEKKWVEHWVDE